VSLQEYRRKRDFKKSAEPPGHRPHATARHRFIIQKHAATHLHYDFRLEMSGVLKSWAVPKGVPFGKGEKRLAVQVEDHPVSYADFEGTIPKGQYGGGTVMLWDTGTYASLSGSPLRAWEAGKIHLQLHGQKLEGEWHLVRLRDAKQWLLIRGGASMRPISRRLDNSSVLSGKTMKELEGTPPAPEPVASVCDRRSHRPVFNGAHRDAATRFMGTTRDKNSGRSRPPAERPRNSPSRARAIGQSPFTFVEPMMAKPVDSPPSGDWIYEIKFDGFRALALKRGPKVALRSRNNNDLGEKFPEIRDAIARIKASNVILDGEIVALDTRGRSSFQLLQAYELGRERPPLFFYAFDLLLLDNKSFRTEPLLERKSKLEKLLKNAPPVLRYSASLAGNVKSLLAKADRLGLEGLIGKRQDSVYEAGRRSGAWVKLKLHRQQEMVIGGFTAPAGSRKHFGALLVGFYERKRLNFAGKVGTGFDAGVLRDVFQKLDTLGRPDCPFANLPEKQSGRSSPGLSAREMRKCRWVEPKLVCQVKFSEWTRDLKLRHPVFLGLREDKLAEGVVRESYPVL
jgi:bifunctional non-homologous end joining protein LigD